MKKTLLAMFLFGQLAMGYGGIDGITQKEFKYKKGEKIYIGRFIQFGIARFQTKIFVEKNGKMKELNLAEIEMLIKTRSRIIDKGNKVFVELGKNKETTKYIITD